MRVLVTGAAGFIGGYLVQELLDYGHEVLGLDNLSKYGGITRHFDDDPRYSFVEGDAKDYGLLLGLMRDVDIVIAGAAMIGGIGYFHNHAYELLAENERILASTFDAAIGSNMLGKVKRIVVISSSMVYESTEQFPTPEGAQLDSPPPSSSYGFQKLSSEYFAKAAFDQYGLPYTIVRPFNCVGVGERHPKQTYTSGNLKLALTHVVPDLVLKTLLGQDPLHILGDGTQVRHYTYGGDLARGIRMAMESEAAIGEDFNLSTAVATSVLELAGMIWEKINPGKPFNWVPDPPFPYDVQHRSPDVTKARDVLGFQATTSLDAVLDELIPWIRGDIAKSGWNPVRY